MRQLWIQVPKGEGKKVLDIAHAYQGSNLATFTVQSQEESQNGQTQKLDDYQQHDLVIVHISNKKVEGLLGDLENIPDLQVTLIPHGVIVLQPPASKAPEQVKEVQERSPIEIFLSGLQSVGSWRGFLSYAALAGAIAWIGLFTNTSYLLVAAMLIAPFAGPAMNMAIATARGDVQLLWRSLLRYFAALIVTIIVAALLSFLLQQQVATNLMIDNSQISAVAVLLPVTAGAAGAIHLMQSERSSLVSGAAVGMLVAASLAPPAGITGMSLAIGRNDIFMSGLFLLLLQLVGINLSAAILFRLYGLSPRGTRYKRGKRQVFPIALGVTVLALTGLLAWQFNQSPSLQRSSRAQRATAAIQEVLTNNQNVQLVEANVRFTRSNITGQNTLLSVLYVQRELGTTLSSDQIRTQITDDVQNQLEQMNFDATPLVQINVLDPPIGQ
ncbi:MAG: hypothetical protein Kow00121_35000 [Elainellaceae cyanobacterium]